ncbi:spermine synthase [Roseiflexus castenholzii DSM 13941]|uniref:Spermine synthase n=1 Tax=Roseiflexus castenholzii (strain DSM 13941 / HLO8) TaxID=383372 RepID=A7NPX3_ROSCS|nr:spermine synthase [Roseiflexus castenholzii DSM 13941]
MERRRCLESDRTISRSHLRVVLRTEQFVSFVALTIFFASGFSALLYQVIWQRILGFFSGADVYSVTIIVAAYMAGMGVGSLTGGYLADRLSRRGNLILFAGVELGIALFALGSKGLYYDWLYRQNAHLASSPLLMVVILFVSLLIPTFCMGVSLPALARALTRSIEMAAGTIGGLYGVNTLGAAVGAGVTTWILLRQYGFETILQMGAAMNALVACTAFPLAWLLMRPGNAQPSQSASHTVQQESPHADQESGRQLPVSVWIALYGLSGFIALSLEILWFRMLGVMLKSTAFTFGTLLTIFLGGLALGTFLGIRQAPRDRHPMRSFLLLQTGVIVFALIALTAFVTQVGNAAWLATFWRYFGGYDPLDVGRATAALTGLLLNPTALDAETQSLAQFFFLLYVMLPTLLIGLPTICMGMSFPMLQKIIQRDPDTLGRRVGWLQTSNIIGSMLGTLLTGLAALSWLGTPDSLRVIGALSGLFLALFAWGCLTHTRVRRATYVGSIVIASGLALIIPDAQTFWATLHGVPPSNAIVTEDNTGLALIKSGSSDFSRRAYVMSNGIGQSAIPYGWTHSVLGFLPTLIHPKPQTIAIIGLGSGDTLFHAGGRPETKELICIEIVGSQMDMLREMAQRREYPALLSILNDPRITYEITDGRSYIMQRGRTYDIIEADALRPNSAYAGNLYSEEYFRLVLNHLNPGGLAVTWVPTERVRTTFIQVFPHYVDFGDILIGSNAPIELDLQAIYQRLEDPFTREYYQRSGVNIKQWLDEYFVKRRPLASDPSAPPPRSRDTNRDLFPRDEFLVR